VQHSFAHRSPPRRPYSNVKSMVLVAQFGATAVGDAHLHRPWRATKSMNQNYFHGRPFRIVIWRRVKISETGGHWIATCPRKRRTVELHERIRNGISIPIAYSRQAPLTEPLLRQRLRRGLGPWGNGPIAQDIPRAPTPSLPYAESRLSNSVTSRCQRIRYLGDLASCARECRDA
jgi:hypothetical protein